jgi:hypothetical protein
MPNIGLTMHMALVFASVLVAASALLRLIKRRWAQYVSAGAWEASLICLLFASWQYVGGLARTHVDGGISHGYAVWHVERAWHLPSEVSVQHLITGHPWLIHVSDWYYGGAHLNSMWMFLVWLFVRHRDKYARWRNVVVLSTGMCLALELIPVAPPRFLTDGTGIVDLPLQYGESVYGFFGSTVAGQLSAMPSVHVGWAVLIAIAVITASPSKWRWLILLHTAMTVFVVVATGNHFWFDGFAAAAFVLLGMLVEWSGRLVLERVRGRLVLRPAPVPT